MCETWKIINGFENYSVSDLGNVRSNVSGKNLTPALNRNRDYYYISIQQNGKRKNFILHRLVAYHFVENKFNKPQVNHINGIKSDNSAKNLEWVTPIENIHHAISHGLVPRPTRGSLQPRAKVNEKQVAEIRMLEKNGEKHRNIAKKYNIGVSTVTHIVNKTRWGWM